MKKSTHKVEVHRILIDDHPNADALGVVKVHDYTVCVRLADWVDGMLGAYIPPDSVVPDTPEFAFLNGKRRIRAKKLRGIVSFGLLVPAPPGAKEGDDVAEQLGITHYEPEIHAGKFKHSAAATTPPDGFHPKYDVDTLRRYRHLFTDGEPVVVTEKIHGSNFRCCYVNGNFHVGSRNEWKKEDHGTDLYWKAFDNSPWLAQFLLMNPGITIYGELIPCQKEGKVFFDYGVDPNTPTVLVFDLLRGTTFLSYDEAHAIGQGLRFVPTVEYRMPFDFAKLEDLATGKTMTDGNHIREGIVVKPIVERNDMHVGRVNMKLVSPDYLEL